MPEVNEIIVLIVFSAGLFPVVLAYIRNPKTLFLLLGYIALFLGSIFTIVEDFAYPNTFNYMEHIVGVAGAGVIIFMATWMTHRRITSTKSEIRQKLGGKN